jgi:hypothetical protein
VGTEIRAELGSAIIPWIADFLTWFACATAAVAVQALLRGQPCRERIRDRVKAR